MEAQYGSVLHMLTPMIGPGQGTQSGWRRDGQYIYVFESFWSGGFDAASTGQLLAHELTHYSGDDNPNHGTALANYNQFIVCPREF